MLNKVVLIGRLTKDPELSYTQNGVPVVRFRLAVNRDFKNQSGEYEADFIPVTAWRTQAENIAKYCAKGRMVAVDGRIQTRDYEQDGQRKYAWEVVANSVKFLEWGDRDQQDQNETPGFNSAGMASDEELPF